VYRSGDRTIHRSRQLGIILPMLCLDSVQACPNLPEEARDRGAAEGGQ